MRTDLLIVTLLLSFSISMESKEIINARDRGIVPDTGCDMLPSLRALFDDVASYGVPVEVRFEPGKYHLFSERASDCSIIKSVGITIDGADSLTIDGCGAEFVGHGAVSPFTFSGCSDLHVKNLVFDWERPLISQGKIVAWNPEYVDVEIDRAEYPYRISGGKAVFYGDDWEGLVSDRSYSTIYDRNGDVLQGTKDYFISRENLLFRGEAEELSDNIIRFHGTPDTYVEPGNRLALYHRLYGGSIFTLTDCSDVVLSDIDIYHSPGMGAFAVQSEDICLDDFNVIVRPDSGRCFSSVADALHFSQCRGKIVVRNSSFGGQGDDALNVHGRYYLVRSVSPDRKSLVLEVTRGLLSEVPEAGEYIWFVRDGMYVTSHPQPVFSVSDVADSSMLLEFEDPLDDAVSAGCHIENADWIPDLEVCGCSFAKSNRARGILFTTSGEVRIHDNEFRSAGAAILIEGDTDYWFESGPVRDVDIYGNIFIDCATSVRDSITHWGWGEAVITVTPSHGPVSDTSLAYHSGITVRDNIFEVFDYPIVYARSVDGLKFSGNEVVKTDSYRPVLWHRNMFTFEGCRNVVIDDNVIDEVFMPLKIDDNMKKSL
ncbi:MAG: hypothetical protein IJZ70_05085 [Bacteroidales bacterium]|nr:hypothetical protein [Bacteroidales bacterium]